MVECKLGRFSGREYILMFLVAVQPYTALYSFLSSSAVPTWRMVNVLLVTYYLLLFRICLDSVQKIYLLFFVFFLAVYCVQQAVLWRDMEFYSLINMLGITALILLVLVIYSALKIRSEVVNVALVWSVCLLIGYQVYQVLSYALGHPELATVLIDTNLFSEGGYFRIVGGYFGPAGLMVESGHLALFVGPVLMYFLVCEYYGIFGVSKLFSLFALLGLALTLSGGAFVQVLFLVILQLLMLLSGKSGRGQLFTSGRKAGLYLIVVLAITLLLLFRFEIYGVLVFSKILSVIYGIGSRAEGASELMGIFWSSPFWGSGVNIDKLGVDDPNTFFPYLLATHGVVLGVAFLLLLSGPVALLFFLSSRKLFVIPFIAQFAHLVFAYGSYMWPSIWIVYALVLYGMGSELKAAKLNCIGTGPKA